LQVPGTEFVLRICLRTVISSIFKGTFTQSNRLPCWQQRRDKIRTNHICKLLAASCRATRSGT
jgi:hypothetical protein